MKSIEISEKLLDKDNWDETLIYVHRSRLILGAVLGFVMGTLFTNIIFLVTK